MTINGISCSSQTFDVMKFMEYVKSRYGVNSSFDSNGKWSFDGSEDNLLRMMADLFVLDNYTASSMMSEYDWPTW